MNCIPDLRLSRRAELSQPKRQEVIEQIAFPNRPEDIAIGWAVP